MIDTTRIIYKYSFDAASLASHNSVFTVSNGYWALKGMLLEDYGDIMPTTIVNGVFDRCNMFSTLPPTKERQWYLEPDYFDGIDGESGGYVQDIRDEEEWSA